MRSEQDVHDPEIGRTVVLLGGRATVRSRIDAHDLLERGLPADALRHLVEHAEVLVSNWAAVGMSLRTYQRVRDRLGKPLNRDQSGRAWIFAEVLGRATALFGSQAEAEAWLGRPAMALDQRRPIDLLSSPAGVQTVEDHLTRLEYGVYT